MKANMRQWRKNLRYLRWVSKAVFLLLFTVPVAYVVLAPWVEVNSLFFGELSFLSLPINQAVCSIWTSRFGNLNPGAWILCPVGGTQILLAGELPIHTIIAMLLFLIPIVLLGNVFCSWVCPIGAVVDGFDKVVEKFFPKVEAKRNERAEHRRQSQRREHEDYVNHLACPSCPVGKIKSKRYGVLANGILASALLGSAIVRFPVFCVVCPMGIISRGMQHLRAVTFITGKKLALIIELLPIPIMAVLLSLRERRFWCKKLCPLGALLNVAGALNPFIKLRVEDKKCVMKGCPDDCEDFHLDYCAHCRLIDDRKCEKVCPVDINLVDHGSYNRCTKCLECYIVCDYNAVKIDLLGKPEVFRIGGFFRRFRPRRRKDKVTQMENQRDASA